MAWLSKSAGIVKLQAQDIVSVMGVKGKVSQVMVMKPETEGLPVDVLVVVDFTRGTGMPTVLNYGEIEAVKGGHAWFNMKGEQVQIS